MSTEPPTPTPDASALPATVQKSWQAFLESYESLRPDLYRYCRFLTQRFFTPDSIVEVCRELDVRGASTATAIG